MSPPSGGLVRQRLGIFGGSFNPPHLAHLALARVARDTLALDALHWIPAGMPWQKPAGALAPAAHRLAMVRLLVGSEPGFVVDERELRRAGPSYTRDTVAELKAEHPGAELVLVIGQDQYRQIDTWRDAAQWRSDVVFAVAARDGEMPRPPAAWASQGAAASHRCVSLPLPPQPVSATRIREMIAAGQPVSSLVGEEVARYIDHHRLYGAHRA